MDAEVWAGLGGILAALVGGAVAYLRKRRKAGGGSFRPRARARVYLSLRTHESDPPPRRESPPPPPDLLPSDLLEEDPPTDPGSKPSRKRR